MSTTINETNTTRYGLPLISLHWLMLILIVAAYATIELRGLYPKGSEPRALLKDLHYIVGLSIFALVWLRLLARRSSSVPKIFPEPPRWQEISATIMHYALYALMIGLPILGWLTVSAEGKSIGLMGFQLPALIAEDKATGKLLEEIHEAIGTIGYGLISLHAAMALFHHYWAQDNTLSRMLPTRR